MTDIETQELAGKRFLVTEDELLIFTREIYEAAKEELSDIVIQEMKNKLTDFFSFGQAYALLKVKEDKPDLTDYINFVTVDPLFDEKGDINNAVLGSRPSID